ncbi:hypothetical protein CCH79_00017990 [Gambusia affinis]|uniref:Uncharacterized protein n=1 Tax=Gambusia affinis TaxID=33528 RepID=A0A315VY13_GAMAF|nr:hypothetical protein CCH79_00017990 [Gambusia affinis]
MHESSVTVTTRTGLVPLLPVSHRLLINNRFTAAGIQHLAEALASNSKLKEIWQHREGVEAIVLFKDYPSNYNDMAVQQRHISKLQDTGPRGLEFDTPALESQKKQKRQPALLQAGCSSSFGRFTQTEDFDPSPEPSPAGTVQSNSLVQNMKASQLTGWSEGSCGRDHKELEEVLTSSHFVPSFCHLEQSVERRVMTETQIRKRRSFSCPAVLTRSSPFQAEIFLHGSRSREIENQQKQQF